MAWSIGKVIFVAQILTHRCKDAQQAQQARQQRSLPQPGARHDVSAGGAVDAGAACVITSATASLKPLASAAAADAADQRQAPGSQPAGVDESAGESALHPTVSTRSLIV